MTEYSLIEAYTVADYELWGGEWELIWGQPVAMTPSPGVVHQRLVASVFRQLDKALADCSLCEALFEIDVELAEDTVVRPDIVVFCYPAKGDRLTLAPELIFEVVSHRSSRRDEIIKYDLYQREGVDYYGLVYPEAKKLKLYRLEEGQYRKVGDFHNQSYRFDLSQCSLNVDFAALWP
ncbi:MAG: Uma2 family endonuclease [Desulfovermiculus sp.]|nr:Uma2 family endonuclease [Desulfovermiculus sp.]